MTPSLEEALLALAVAKRAGERAAFLDRECADDAALRHRLEALLAAHEKAGGVLGDEPAAGDRRGELHESPTEDQGPTQICHPRIHNANA